MALRQIPDSDTLREAFDTTYNNDSSIEQQLGSKAAGDHTHEGYAPTNHTHDYAPSAHSHANYQALLETNLDLLMRGLLYTKASPFSQSFTFSGDGTKTAFKIPRADVQQQGWVRGGVTATVDGASVSGTWNIHTQTYTLSAAPASGASVVVSATDVVPYQGMAASVDGLRIVYMLKQVNVTTNGTGISTSLAHPHFPVSVKLPAPEADVIDDRFVNDSVATTGFPSIGSMLINSLPAHVHRTGPYERLFSGAAMTLSPYAGSRPRKRGAYAFNGFNGYTGIPWLEGPNLNAAFHNIRYSPALYRVENPASGSVFFEGELLLGLMVGYSLGSTVYVSAQDRIDSAFDLFRLSGGPIVEA